MRTNIYWKAKQSQSLILIIGKLIIDLLLEINEMTTKNNWKRTETYYAE